MIKILLLFLCSLFIGCTHSEKKEDFIRTVKCDTVKAVDHTAEQSIFSGRVKAALEGNVAFRVAGQIVRMDVVQGQFVSKGSAIAQLDNRDYLIALSATEAEYNRIKSEADRVITLYKTQSVTPNDYDKAIYGLRQISSKLEAHRNALSDTRLLAPYDGYIEKIYFNQGETVGAGTAVVSMISSQRPEIEINIPTTDFIKQDRFESASATIHAFEDTVFELKLIGINQKANLNQLYTTRFEVIGNPKPSPGMTAIVTVNYKNDSAVLMQIPVTALVGNSVWILKGEKVTKRNVHIAVVKSNGSVWVEGLKEGEIVVSGGGNSLKEGQRVRPLHKKSKTNQGGLL